MGSQIWGDVNSLYYSFGLYHFFFLRRTAVFPLKSVQVLCKQVSVLLYEIFDVLFETTEH